MELIKFLAAFGFGGICVKVVDLLWLQPFLERREIRGWLRDRKLIAFSKVAENFQSIGLSEDDECLFKSRTIISEAQLLISNEDLCQRLETHIQKRYQLCQMTENTKESQILFDDIYKESNEIILELKGSLRSSNA
jgi:hypothetical protein